MAHRNALDCDWCGAKDIRREDTVRISVNCVGSDKVTPAGVKIAIEGTPAPVTWIEVCGDCAEKAEVALRVWARETPFFTVNARAWDFFEGD